MPWGRLDDSLYDNPKLDRLGKDRLACVGLWTLSISWCNRYLTDGLVPHDRIGRLGGTIPLADRLVEVGLYEPDPDGYVIHDFLHFNDSKSDVESRREYERTRQRERRRVAGNTNPDTLPTPHVVGDTSLARAGAAAAAFPSRPLPARPFPAPPKPPAAAEDGYVETEEEAKRVRVAAARAQGMPVDATSDSSLKDRVPWMGKP